MRSPVADFPNGKFRARPRYSVIPEIRASPKFVRVALFRGSPKLLDPIVQTQSGDGYEISGVMRHHCQVVRECDRSDHQINDVRRLTGSQLSASNFAEAPRAGRIEIQDGDLFQQRFNAGQQTAWIAGLKGASIKFGHDDSGYENPAAILYETVRYSHGSHVRRADVCVQQKAQYYFRPPDIPRTFVHAERRP